MKEYRGKEVALVSDINNNNNKLFSSSSPDLPCPKHPNSSSVGICAYCLKDRLVKLVCSDCGEQRLSSCSCSDISVVEVGSVGRISFLIENEKADKEITYFASHDPNTIHPSETTTNAATAAAANAVLKRSSSSTIDVKSSSRNSSKFWRFGRSLFRKRRGIKFSGGELVVDDGKSEIWVSDQLVGISRSKSISAVRGSAPTTTNTTTTTTTTSGLFDCHSEIGFGGLSTRVSDVNKDWHSETERRSGGFSKPKYGLGLIDIIDDDQDDLYSAGFIDLKLSNGTDQFNESSESEFRLSKESDFSELLTESHQLFDQYPQFYNCGGSCRITVNDHFNNRDMKKKCKKSSKVWKWILKNQSSSATISGRD
ncbi:hypothetical protein Syun_023099 [Stephania yunnanensis]|uniref:Uncharacterized protein n=1 Tax=Stephania yunnanensis TaxID=152371 RepID=A0AAP0FFK7_9MAGN